MDAISVSSGALSAMKENQTVQIVVLGGQNVITRDQLDHQEPGLEWTPARMYKVLHFTDLPRPRLVSQQIN